MLTNLHCYATVRADIDVKTQSKIHSSSTDCLRRPWVDPGCKFMVMHITNQNITDWATTSCIWWRNICCVILGECTTFTLSLALQARSRALGPLSPSFELVKNLRLALAKFLPDNAHEIASGRLFISLTRVSDRKNILVSEFCDKSDLIDVSIIIF